MRWPVAMDSHLTALVEAIVEGIDDRFGRPAAWLAAVVGLFAIIAVPFAIVLYLLRWARSAGINTL